MATIEEFIAAIRKDANGWLDLANQAEASQMDKKQLLQEFERQCKASDLIWVELLGDPIQKHLHRKGQL